MALFRIAQEALTNVSKHAQAGQVTIQVEPLGDGVCMTIADNGIGFEFDARYEFAGEPGWGLMTMRERAESVGGPIARGIKTRPGDAGHCGGTEDLTPQRTFRGYSMPIRVYLADDHAVVREGLRYLLEAQGDVVVVGDAADGREAVQEVLQQQPDVVIMDIAMPGLNGIEATQQIRQALPSTRIIILSIHADAEHVFRALRAGAKGYLLKEAAGREVVEAVRTVYAGHRFLSQRIGEIVLERYLEEHPHDLANPLEPLASREREILRWVAQGKSSSQIGQILHLLTKRSGNLPRPGYGEAEDP